MPRSRAGLAAILVVLLAGAVALRCRFMNDVFLEGRVLPFDPDSSYHLWRIEETVRSGAPPHVDPFVNAPDGARVIWPDGFDALVGTVARLGGAESTFDVQLAALVFVPLCAALALLAVFALALVAFGSGAAALVAVAIAAVVPAHGQRSMLGLVDHHVLELTLTPAALAALLAGGGRRVARALAAGAALAAAVWSFPTASLHLVVVAAAAGVAALTDRETATARLVVLAAAMGVAGLLVLPLALGHPGLAFEQPSALPAVLLGGGALVAGALALAARRGRGALLATATVVAGGAGVAAWVLRGAVGFVGGHGMVALVTEAQPLVRHLDVALELHGAGIFLLPIALVVLARRGPAARGVATAAVAGLVLTGLQQRFETLLVPAEAAILGAAFVGLAGRARRLAPVVALVALALYLPCARWWRDTRLLSDDALAVLEASEWLAAHTPDAGPRAPGAHPPYTVLTLWGVGSHYAYLGRRPVLAAGFQHGDYERGVTDAVTALYGDGDVEPLLARRAVRYAVIPTELPVVERMHRIVLGLGPARRPTLHQQLAALDGSAAAGEDGVLVPARDRMRLVHENGRIKVFERVPGAVVTGACEGPLLARMVVVSDVGRSFDWVNPAPCTAGRFELRVPYVGQVELSSGQRAVVTENDVTSGATVSP